MKVVSMNIRGLGGNIKRNYLRNLISKEQTDMVCIQETKCSKLSKESVCLLWGLMKFIGLKMEQVIVLVGLLRFGKRIVSRCPNFLMIGISLSLKGSER